MSLDYANQQQIQSILLANPLVEDCYLLKRDNQLIAYIIYSGAWNPEQLSSYLSSQLPANILPNIYVPITCLPLTNKGYVDEPALKNIPIIDDNLVKHTEKKLQSLPEIDQIAVIVSSQLSKIPPLHLSELLPLKETKIVEKNNQAIEEKINNIEYHTDKLAISHGKTLLESELQPKTLGSVLEKTVKDYPTKGIIYIESHGVAKFQSYSDLWEEAQKIHTGLKKLGLQTEDKVIFQLSENSEIMPAFWGCILGGFIPVIMSVSATYKDFNNDINKICQVWELLEKPLIITSNCHQKEIQNLEKWLPNQTLKISCIEDLKNNIPQQNYHNSKPDDVAFFSLTSGSTGLSKCIPLTHKNLISRARGTNIICEHHNDDIILNWLPFDHIGSISDWHIRCVEIGCQMVYVQTDYILGHPLNWLNLIDKHRITHSWAPNFAYSLINETLQKSASQSWNLDCIKFFLAAGEAVSDKAVTEFIDKLHTQYNLAKTAVRPAFGMAEMASGITYYQPTPQNPLLFHSIDKTSLKSNFKRVHLEHPNAATFTDLGLPIPSISIRIVDKDNNILPEETIGNFQVKGDAVSPGYYKNPQANQEAFLADGWFNTGDLGFISNGHLVVTGRSKETIIINGVNYYSHEIEKVVEEIQGVEISYTAACAVKHFHSNTDHLALFFSVENFALNDLAELLKKIRQKVISSFGVNPEYLIPLKKNEIPKTSIGKIQRSQLTQRFENCEFKAILKQVDIVLENANTIPDWFYRKVWQGKNSLITNPKISENYTLIFLDKLGLGDDLVEKLKVKNLPYITVKSGEQFNQIYSNIYTINANKIEDYQRLMQSLFAQNIKIDNIIHLWNYEEYKGEINSKEELEKAQEIGIYSLLFLIQALAKIEDINQKIQLLFVASYSQFVIEKDNIAYEKSPVLGLIKTISQEISWLNPRHIDLTVDKNETNSNYLLQELAIVSKDREIAYRNGQRFIPVLKKVNLPQQPKQELPFKKDGIYLITGGLGGIGFKIAEYLLKNYQTRLILIGKTPLNPPLERGEGYQVKIQNFQALKNLGGEVIYRDVDVSNLTELQRILQQIKTQWQGELDGIIHLAGVYQEGLILEETKENLAKVLHPKVLGTWVLNQLLKKSQGIFINFSSLASFFGGTNLGAYAAANRFLENFNDYQRTKKIHQNYCYSWTAWQETGMSKGYHNEFLLKSQGYYGMTATQGLDSFLASLHHNQNQLMIGLDDSNLKVKRYTSIAENLQKLTAYYTLKNPVKSLNLDTLILQDAWATSYDCKLIQKTSLPLTDKGIVDIEQLLKQLRNQENNEHIAPRNEVETKIAFIWQDVLNLSTVSINDNFFELGGHSLLAIQVISQLRDSFLVELSLQSLLEYPTVAKLAQVVDVLSIAQNGQMSMNEINEDYEEGEL